MINKTKWFIGIILLLVAIILGGFYTFNLTSNRSSQKQVVNSQNNTQPEPSPKAKIYRGKLVNSDDSSFTIEIPGSGKGKFIFEKDSQVAKALKVAKTNDNLVVSAILEPNSKNLMAGRVTISEK